MARTSRSTAAEIPDKLYFRIGEVSRLTGVKSHTLRFWEGEFGRLRPEKSSSGQRRYTRADIELVLRIKDLLKNRKFTIAGARSAISKGEEKDPQDLPAADLPHVSEEFIAQEAALIEKASSLEARERDLAERRKALEAREQALERRLREAQEALASRMAQADRDRADALQEQAHEVDMLRTRGNLLEKRAEEALAELDDVRLREARMTRAMAQVRRGIIELRHRLHEAGRNGS